MTNCCSRRRLRNRKRSGNWCGKRWRAYTSWRCPWRWRLVPDRIGGICSEAVGPRMQKSGSWVRLRQARCRTPERGGRLRTGTWARALRLLNHLRTFFALYGPHGCRLRRGDPGHRGLVAGGPERGAPGIFLGGAHEQYFAGVGHRYRH